MGLKDVAKRKLLDILFSNLAAKCERGEFGRIPQIAYVKTKGKKTVIGIALLAFQAALLEFMPPGYEGYLQNLALITSGLTSAAILDKLDRNEPIFEPWLLEAIQRITLAIAGISLGATWLVSRGLLEAWFPGHPCLSDYVTAGCAALTAAAGLLNRMAAASATKGEARS